MVLNLIVAAWLGPTVNQSGNPSPWRPGEQGLRSRRDSRRTWPPELSVDLCRSVRLGGVRAGVPRHAATDPRFRATPRWTLPEKDYHKYTYQPSIPDKRRPPQAPLRQARARGAERSPVGLRDRRRVEPSKGGHVLCPGANRRRAAVCALPFVLSGSVIRWRSSADDQALRTFGGRPSQVAVGRAHLPLLPCVSPILALAGCRLSSPPSSGQGSAKAPPPTP